YSTACHTGEVYCVTPPRNAKKAASSQLQCRDTSTPATRKSRSDPLWIRDVNCWNMGASGPLASTGASSLGVSPSIVQRENSRWTVAVKDPAVQEVPADQRGDAGRGKRQGRDSQRGNGAGQGSGPGRREDRQHHLRPI